MRGFIKWLLALAMLVVIVVIWAPPLLEYSTKPTSIDHGDRALVVISSSGGNKDYTLRSRTFVNHDGSGSLVFDFAADDISFGPGGTTQSINYFVTVSGVPKGSNLRCGANQSLTQMRYTDLSAGRAEAIRIDSLGGRGSATNYSNESTDENEEVLKDLTVFEYHGWSWQRESSSSVNSTRVIVGDGSSDQGVWSDSCIFDAPFIWRWPSSSAFEASDERTLLLPQLNWTSSAERTDYQSEWLSDLVVDRIDGYALAESNPEFVTYDSYYYYQSFIRWNGQRGSLANVAWTDQPVQLYQGRSLELDDGRLALWGGVLIGLGVTLALHLVSKAYDGISNMLARNLKRKDN